PAADSGRMSPALTTPVPMVAASGVCGDCGGVEDRYCEGCEQPARNAPALPKRPATARRRVGQPAETCNCADTAVLPPAAPSAPLTAPYLCPLSTKALETSKIAVERPFPSNIVKPWNRWGAFRERIFVSPVIPQPAKRGRRGYDGTQLRSEIVTTG